ncbi:MAG: hypothetical protein GY725_13365 [bacterium]|nr:hypothetical protein [bacterium]
MSVINDMLRDLENRREEIRPMDPGVLEGLRSTTPRESEPTGGSHWMSVLSTICIVGTTILGFALLERRIGDSAIIWQSAGSLPAAAAEPSTILVREAALALLDVPHPEPHMQGSSGTIRPNMSTAMPPAPWEEVRLVGTHLEQSEERTQLTFELSAETTHVVERDDADDIELVLLDTRLTDAPAQLKLGGTLLRSVHVSGGTEDVRILLEPAVPVRVQSTMVAEAGAARLVLTFEPSLEQEADGFRSRDPLARFEMGYESYDDGEYVSDDDSPSSRPETSQNRSNEGVPASDGFRKTAVAIAEPSPAERAFLRAAKLIAAGIDGIGVESLREAAAYDPMHIGARNLLISTLIRLDRLEEASVEIEKGRAIAPGDPSFAKLEARLLIERDEPSKALAVLVTSPPAILKDPEYHAMIAALYQRAGDHVRAANSFRKLLSLRADRAPWWMGLGISLEGAGQPNEALIAYRNAVRLGSMGEESLDFTRGRIAMLGEGTG